jgi:hypothetical protein
MARPNSPHNKFKGTIDNLTYVDSIAYGLHTRAKKGTHTPFVMTEALAKSRDLLQICNHQGRAIFGALQDERRDGRLWSRLVSLFFAELKAGRTINVQCLRNLECNLTYKLDDIISRDYEIVVKKEKKKLGIHVRLQKHPKAEDKVPREGYHLRFVVVYPDFEKGTFRKEVAIGPFTKYKSALQPVELEVPMPSAKAPFIVLMTVVPIVQGKPFFIVRDAAMKVVYVSEA